MVWLWLIVTIFVPLAGVVLRAFVSNWGMGVSLLDVLSLDAFRSVWGQSNLLRAIVNSVAIGVFGGALAVACYTCIGLAMHRKPDHVTRFLDYSVLVPRARPGAAGGAGLPVGVPVRAAVVGQRAGRRRLAVLPALHRLAARQRRGMAALHTQHDLQRVAGLHRRVDGLWTAADSSTLLQVGPESGGSRAQRRRPPRRRSSRATSPCRWHATG